MATIPTPGSELRHVRKTVTFTGGAGAGAVGLVTLFPVTGAVIIERLVPFCTVDMVSATNGAEIALTDADDASGPYSTTTASAIDAGFLWDRSSGDNGWGFDAVSVGSVFVAYKDVCLKITIEDITAGAMRFDVWYRPITDDGALAGDDIDEPMRDHFWSKALSDIASVPAMTASALSGLNWLFALARNKRTQTATTETVYKDDGSTSLATSTKSDDGTTYTRGEYS